MPGIELRSPAFDDHAFIPPRFAKERDDVPPPLEWDGLPDGTSELLLICEDPDAPAGVFTHWAVAGLPVGVHGVNGSGLPRGAVEGRNSYGDLGYGGPQPPAGDAPHRYFFHLYALDRRSGLEEGFSPEELRRIADAHAVAAGTIIGLFQR